MDTHTALDHAMPHCTSHELYKGILAGKARAVFNGRIIVRIDATFTGVRGGPGDINSPRDNMNAFDTGLDTARAMGMRVKHELTLYEKAL